MSTYLSKFEPPILLKSQIKDQLYYAVYPQLYVWLNSTPVAPEYDTFALSYKLTHTRNQFILILHQLGYSIVERPSD